MICFHSSVEVDHRTDMSKSAISTYPQSKPRNKKNPNSPCEKPRPAVIVDVIILLAVISASSFLLYPYARFISRKSLEVAGEIADVVSEEFGQAPYVFACLGLSILLATTALVSITVFSDRRCGRTGCRGLRKAAEFDIQLETEDCDKKKSSNKSGLKMGLFELPRDHHRELEAELKTMAPVNGRAILVFRARCGCSVGRMEVPGPPRKSKKVIK